VLKMVSEICFYGGLNQIGGNKILIKDSGESIFFDFGLSFSDQQRFFSEYLQPRTVNGIGDYLCFNLIPDIPGLYRNDLALPINYPVGEPPIDAIFLTHAHMDHFGLVSLVNEDITVYASTITNKIIESYETVSQSGIDKEFSVVKKRPYGEYIHHSKWNKKNRSFHKWDEYDGSFRIKFFPVDHSIWGAGGYFIETSDRIIVYTGDFRQHGERRELTINSLNELKSENIDVLIIEGTNIGNEQEEKNLKHFIEQILGKPLGKKLETEYELKMELLQIIEGTKTPIFIDYGLRDFDRFKTILTLAQECDKKLVIPMKVAQHLKDLTHIIGIEPTDDSLLIFQEPKRLGSYDEREYYKWEREILEYPNIVRNDYVKQNLNELIITMNYFQLKNLIDFKPSNGIYIHSTSEPFNEEQAIDFRRHLEWIKFFNLDYYYVHISGHMGKDEILSYIEELSPKKIIPVHTNGAEIFEQHFPNVFIPKLGQII